MEFLSLIFGAAFLLFGFAIWDDLKQNINIGWGKIALGLIFGIIFIFYMLK